MASEINIGEWPHTQKFDWKCELNSKFAMDWKPVREKLIFLPVEKKLQAQNCFQATAEGVFYWTEQKNWLKTILLVGEIEFLKS